MTTNDPWPAILVPWIPQEAISTTEAAARADVCARTIREWCDLHRIGRRIGGRFKVSIVALDMFLSGDEGALSAYLNGERRTEPVSTYFTRHFIPLP